MQTIFVIVEILECLFGLAWYDKKVLLLFVESTPLLIGRLVSLNLPSIPNIS